MALMIFGVLAITVLTRMGDNIRTEQYLESKTLAAMIAENTLTQLRLSRDWSDVADKSDTVEMAGQEWAVRIEVGSTPNENLKRVDVRVGPVAVHGAEQSYAVVLTSFLGRY